MSPNALVLIDAPENEAASHANVESNTIRSLSGHNNGFRERESGSAAVPPPYTNNTPLDDPFQYGDAPVGFFHPGSDGMPKGLQSAMTTRTNPFRPAPAALVETLPPLSTIDVDPFADGMVPDESLPLPPPHPVRPSGLRRGLSIPSRISIITFGFSFPKVLAEQGVTEAHWKMFKRELESFACMSKSQYVTVIACNLGVGHFFGPIAGGIVGWKMQKHREHENFLLAYQGGAMKMFEDRWNGDYFHRLGLHVRIEPPGVGKVDGMDVSSSKLFRYQQKMGTSSPAPGVASTQGDTKEYRYQAREGRYRMKAMRKGRVVMVPLNLVKPVPLQPTTAG